MSSIRNLIFLLLLACPAQAAISFRAASAVANADQVTSITLTLPTGAVATDVLIACFSADTTTAITAPAGWTLIASISGTLGHTEAWWALGNVSSHVFTTDSGATTVGFELAYIGVDNTTPMDATATTQANASSTTATAPSITTVTNNAWFVSVFGTADVAKQPTYTFNAPLTGRQSGGFAGANNMVTVGAGDAVKTPAGATGATTATLSLASVNEGIQAALRPSGGAPPACVPAIALLGAAPC